jgi:iron only hydrogenase large subunit-like protein
MVECNWIDETEFERVAAEATARMTGGDWSFKREICIYETNYCTGCMRCADEDLISEANSNYIREAFDWRR